MNYRHAFHAGNFADLIKHAVLTDLLQRLAAGAGPLTVIDTHAGAGLYDLAGGQARATGEGEIGIRRLMTAADAPAVFEALKAAVRRANAPGEVRWYPGSPVLIEAALRPRDRLIAFELRGDDHAALKQVLPRQAGAQVRLGDGWTQAVPLAPAAPASLLVHVDPPFERGDDYANTAQLLGRVLARNPGAIFALWLPIKDLAAYDAFLGEAEDTAAGRPILAVEVRLRPLTDPMRLNGCAVVVVSPPPGLAAPARVAAEWVARALGEAGSLGRVTVFGGAV